MYSFQDRDDLCHTVPSANSSRGGSKLVPELGQGEFPSGVGSTGSPHEVGQSLYEASFEDTLHDVQNEAGAGGALRLVASEDWQL